MASYVEKSVEVNVPVEVAYNQWTQFEEFPKFMEGVEEVKQITDSRLHWKAKIGGKEKEWDAEIVEQTPDTRIEWKTVEGPGNSGIVTFLPLDGSCKITARIMYEPEGFVEQVGDFLGFLGGRVEGDLKRFKEFVESRGRETGAWRGEIHNAQTRTAR